MWAAWITMNKAAILTQIVWNHRWLPRTISACCQQNTWQGKIGRLRNRQASDLYLLWFSLYRENELDWTAQTSRITVRDNILNLLCFWSVGGLPDPAKRRNDAVLHSTKGKDKETWCLITLENQSADAFQVKGSRWRAAKVFLRAIRRGKVRAPFFFFDLRKQWKLRPGTVKVNENKKRKYFLNELLFRKIRLWLPVWPCFKLSSAMSANNNNNNKNIESTNYSDPSQDLVAEMQLPVRKYGDCTTHLPPIRKKHHTLTSF